MKPVLEKLEGPEGVDVGADGRVYVAEARVGRLIAFDPEGRDEGRRCRRSQDSASRRRRARCRPI